MAWYDGLVDFATSDTGGKIISGGLGLVAGMEGGQDQVKITKPYMLPGQEQYLSNFLNTAIEQYGDGPKEYYPGSAVAGLDPTLIQGQNAALSTAGKMGGMSDAMMEGGAKLMSGGPMVGGFQLPDQVGFGIDQGLADAVTNPIYRNLEERIMPSMDLAATSQGAFGGTRQALMKGQAAANANEQAMEALTRANLQARQQSIGQRAGDISAQLQGRGQDINQVANSMNNIRAGMHYMPGAINAALAPANVMMDVGQDRTAYNQQLINADMNRWNFEQQAPIDSLSLLGQRLNMQFPGGTTTLQGQDATWLDGFAGAATGVGLYNDIFQPQPPAGTK